jgi:aspartate 1-decarboxylase
MLIPFLIAKIHRATVTQTCVDYEGSISIDEEIIEKAGLKPLQKVEIYDINNGNRFATYVIPQARGSHQFVINGAAALLANPGDRIIVAAYGLIDEKELNTLRSVILTLNENNEVIRITDGKL